LADIVEGRQMPMPTSKAPLVLGSTENAERRYYLRFSVTNQAGVLAQITSVFWKYNISIAGVIQKEPVSAKFVPVVITTYAAKEKDMLAALHELDKLPMVKVATKFIRILSANT
jgi:homoserine dehydrogenase